MNSKRLFLNKIILNVVVYHVFGFIYKKTLSQQVLKLVTSFNRLVKLIILKFFVINLLEYV